MKQRHWLIQELSQKDQDMFLIEKLLKQEVAMESGDIIYDVKSDSYGPELIPVGDISFVENWLKNNFGKRMVPIEVPEVLRIREFLGRSYRIVDRDQLPYDGGGRYFVKNVSMLNGFNSSSDHGKIPPPSTLPYGQYVVCDWLDIRSEFRVFVYRDEILAIQNYAGSPLIFPHADRIVKIAETYRRDENRPGAYIMDIAVIARQDQSADTILLEIQPFACCKLYGFSDTRIPDMLEEGIRYYKGIKQHM